MKSLLVCQHWSGCIALPIPNPHSLDISWWLTIVVERFLVRVALGDHHSHDDVLETWQGKHTGVLHVGQIGFSGRCWIKWNIPIKTKRQGMTFYCVLNCIMCKCCASPFSPIFFLQTIPVRWWWRGQPAGPGWSCRSGWRCCLGQAEPADWLGVCSGAAPHWGLLSPSQWPAKSSDKCPRTGTAGQQCLSSAGNMHQEITWFIESSLSNKGEDRDGSHESRIVATFT